MKYRWPASRLGEAEMRLLFQARAQAPKRTTIAGLVAEAIQNSYGQPQEPDNKEPRPWT